MIVVDSSVLIDVIAATPEWKDWSASQLTRYAAEQGLAINVIVYAEVSRVFATAKLQNQFIKEAGIKVLPISNEVAFLAARAHASYRAAGGNRLATLPDFFIGAHAQDKGYALLTRDPVRIRNYFPKVRLISP